MPTEAHKFIDEYVSIGSKARDLRENGVDPRKSYSESIPGTPVTFTAEYAALTAVVCDAVIAQAIDQRDQYAPLGLITFQDSNPHPTFPTKYSGIRDQLIDTLLHTHQQITDDMRSVGSTKSPFASVYRRRKQVERELNISDSLSRGIDTAVSEMTVAFTTMTQLFQQKFPDDSPSIETLLQTARNSWPYIHELASMHIHVFNNADADLERFTLEEKNGSYEHKLTPEAKQEFRTRAFEQSVPYYRRHPRYGCPARVNFGSGSAIRRLWDWYIDIVDKVYHEKHPGEPIYSMLGTEI